MSNFQHVSVLPQEVINALDLSQGGIFVDGTLGGGGHSKLILDKLPPGSRLIGIDRDANAIKAATQHCSEYMEEQQLRFSLSSPLVKVQRGGEAKPLFQAVQGNFHNIPQILQDLGVPAVNGILLDLGVSSHQLDTPERGFSYRFDGPLDMRMDTTGGITASDIVNTYSEKALADLIFTYGEERHSRRISRAICIARATKPIATTLELVSIIEKAAPKQKFGMPHPAMRTFMAIRIAVNDELSPLGNVLENIVNCLAPGGRIGVITFHSLEDRITKTTFQKIASPCQCPHTMPYCVCGKKPGLRIITKKPILPTEDEVKNNKRAHSAKLRVAEKIYYAN